MNLPQTNAACINANHMHADCMNNDRKDESHIQTDRRKTAPMMTDRLKAGYIRIYHIINVRRTLIMRQLIIVQVDRNTS